MEQAYLKEEEELSGVDDKGEPLHVATCGKSEELVKRINEMMGVFRKVLDRRPLSKAHLVFSASIAEIAK